MLLTFVILIFVADRLIIEAVVINVCKNERSISYTQFAAQSIGG